MDALIRCEKLGDGESSANGAGIGGRSDKPCGGGTRVIRGCMCVGKDNDAGELTGGGGPASGGAAADGGGCCASWVPSTFFEE